MPRRIRSFDDPLESAVDVFEAIKRALIHRGLIRQKTKSRRRLIPTIRRHKRLIEAAVGGHDILFKADTVFPFTLFPDTVVVDREKMTLATRYFFGVARIISVPIRDMLNVEADVGPFFGSVHTASRYFITTPLTIKWLWRRDAVKLQRLLQGYIIAHEQDIDCTKIAKHRLIALLNDLGRGDTD